MPARLWGFERGHLLAWEFEIPAIRCNSQYIRRIALTHYESLIEIFGDFYGHLLLKTKPKLVNSSIFPFVNGSCFD